MLYFLHLIYGVGIATTKVTQLNTSNPIKSRKNQLRTVVGGGYSNGADVPSQYYTL